MGMQDRIALQYAVEQFLFHEAELLDALKFEDWFALFTSDGEYLIPSTDVPTGQPSDVLFLIQDDWNRLRGRVTRLQSRDAHADYPHPRTRHLITNVRPQREGGGVVDVRASFVVYALRVGKIYSFIGEYEYRLLQESDSFRITRKRANLDLESLEQAGGKVHIIV